MSAMRAGCFKTSYSLSYFYSLSGHSVANATAVWCAQASKLECLNSECQTLQKKTLLTKKTYKHCARALGAPI